jgi:Ni/Fe-hydrogenase 1 B-type cytochrome subunit
MAAPAGLVRVYVWQAPVRLTHWLLAGSLFVLAATGFYLGHPLGAVPGEASRHFVMGTVKLVHFGAAIVFTLSVLARVAWMFVGNRYARWNQFLPTSGARLRGIFSMAAFYSFLRRDPPHELGHNALAGLVYSAVFALCFVQIVTGLALYGASADVDSPLRVFGGLAPLLGGLQASRFVHHLVMWLLLGFFAHHLWSGLLVALTERNGLIGSMVTGFKFVPRAQRPPTTSASGKRA